MQFNTNIQGNIVITFRRLGYKHIGVDQNSGELSFVRPFDASGYPRFHIYYNQTKGIINIHLDQKKPVYDDQKAHDADYDGPVVEGEVARLKNLL
jgi:hypothetical protein